MSVRKMSEVYDLELDHPEQAILLALADHADDDGVCWPSVYRLMWKTGYGKTQVKSILSKLRDELKLIALIERGGGRSNPNKYRLTLENGVSKRPFSEWVAEEKQKGRNPSLKGSVASDPEPSQRTIKEPSYDSSLRSLSAESLKSASPEQEKVMSIKQYAVKELMERVSAAREGGWTLHSPTNNERKQFAAMFEQAVKDGFETEVLLLAFDYQIAKAADKIEGEKPAWCGYRTALDRIVEGWRPKYVVKKISDEEIRAKEEYARETQRIIQAALEEG